MSKLRFLFFLLSIILLSCKTKQNRETSYKKPYHREDNELKAQLFLYHGINNTSFVYYKINNSQLLYKKIDTNNYFSSRIRVSYKFTPTADARQILDSGTVYIEDKSLEQPQSKNLIGYIPLSVSDGQDSYLELFVQDVFGKRNQTHYIHCNKQNSYSQQNFLFQTQNKEIIFSK